MELVINCPQCGEKLAADTTLDNVEQGIIRVWELHTPVQCALNQKGAVIGYLVGWFRRKVHGI